MKIFKLFASYKEDVILLVLAVIYLIAIRVEIHLIIYFTIIIGVFLYYKKYFFNRLILKYQALEKQMIFKNTSDNKGKVLQNDNTSDNKLDERKFKEEMMVLRKVIHYAEECSEFYKYKGLEAEKFVDERCKPFIDLVAPILAVEHDSYQLVIQTRPSLKKYVDKKIEDYFDNRPDIKEIEAEYYKVHNIFTKKTQSSFGFDINRYGCAYILIHKFGFCQEVFIVVKKVNPKLFEDVLYLYNSRLSSIAGHFDMSYECFKNPENAGKIR